MKLKKKQLKKALKAKEIAIKIMMTKIDINLNQSTHLFLEGITQN